MDTTYTYVHDLFRATGTTSFLPLAQIFIVEISQYPTKSWNAGRLPDCQRTLSQRQGGWMSRIQRIGPFQRMILGKWSAGSFRHQKSYEQFLGKQRYFWNISQAEEWSLFSFNLSIWSFASDLFAKFMVWKMTFVSSKILICLRECRQSLRSFTPNWCWLV